MEDYNKILSELKFLSKLRKGEKIMVKAMTVQQADIFSGIYRAFVGEKRQATLDFVCDLWQQTVEILLSEECSEECRKTLCENLFESRKGINSLLATYESDRFFCSKLESLLTTSENSVKERFPNFSLSTQKENAGLGRTLSAQEASLKKS